MLATLRHAITRFFGSDEVELHFAAPPPTTDQGERQHYFTHPGLAPRAAEPAERRTASRDAARISEAQGASRS